MCGIFGIISKNSIKKNDLNLLLEVLKHRGPDGNGIWCDDKLGIYLGHTRLSILDLSAKGSQPMISQNQRYIISYNGEIYNHLEIRKQLKNETNFNNWLSTSDTETLLVAIENWGIEKTLSKVSGMFAFAFFDRKNNDFFLVRDRVGEKPLYYGCENNNFMFASELKIFKKSNHFKCEINESSITSFIKYSYIPANHSIYKNIYKLKPGNYLKINLNNISNINIKPYWSVNLIKKNKNNLSEEKVLNKFENLLIESINEQRISDVPLGVFLSSGYDSSLIASLLQNQSKNKIDTFTIGFTDPNFNESNISKKISKHIGSNHNELIVDTNNIHSMISQINNVYDEPFADSSQIPTLLLSQFSKQKVKVCLTGDGADELFGGYNRYVFENQIYNTPYLIRYFLKYGIDILGNNFLVKFINNFNSNFRNVHSKINKLSSILLVDNDFQRYDILTSSSNNFISIIQNPKIDNNNKDIWDLLGNLSSVEKMMVLDFLTYLPDDILCKVDRATMSTSLENRSPFLSKELIEFAFNLPLKFKIRKNNNKWLIRELSKKYLPEKIMNRPKQGFAIPLASWLRTSLREWAEELINKDSIIIDQFLNRSKIIQIWNNHINMKEDNHHLLWNLLMLLSWQQND